MALIQTTFIWIAYGVAVAIVALIASIFTFVYQSPRDRSALVTTVTIITLTSLLATVLLLPVDIAHVSATTRSNLGVKKDWATPERVGNILLSLKVVYYILYSLDALLCLIVIPFTYFWYEDVDDAEEPDRTNTFGRRFWNAFKYALIFIVLVVLLFLVGFFLPVADHKGAHMDLDYFRRLLTENYGERALTFTVGLLISLGVLLYVFYTASGFALLPISLIKSAPSISAPQLTETTASALEQNRERQRQLEGRNAGRQSGLSPKDQREFESLVREERTLVRRLRLASEAQGNAKGAITKIWVKLCAIFRPFKLLGGIFLLLLAIVVCVSMLITGIDKAKNSICKGSCGYVLGHINIVQPMNFIFAKSAEAFPVDYVLMALLVLFFFSSSVSGIANMGIRFLWVNLFGIRKGRSPPQALLIATVLLSLVVLAINYSITMIVAPQYSIYGTQTLCQNQPRHPGEQPDCSNHPELVQPCSELSRSKAAGDICTPSVMSTFLNRITLNYPFFGDIYFWAQFAFLIIFTIVFTTALFRTPKLNFSRLDEEAEFNEEEGLLASTGRRLNATWQDITGRSTAPRKPSGNTGAAGRGVRGQTDDDDD